MPPFPSTADGLIVGVVDASLAMMSALTVAESLGLGTCPIGYARTAAPEELSRLMRLPQGVFVICGLALGVPREQPDMKPKQQESLIIHHEHYCDENIAEGVTTYDKEITDYTASRSGNVKIHDWTGNILSYRKSEQVDEKKENEKSDSGILDKIKNFDLMDKVRNFDIGKGP